ncbi:hypothetical protein AMATHDRAFT_51855 [Amanita thiersii Skay4041]|uniref:Uncharacterized protein n=1 Tax=Amanita thiersii Skay4041 TaxID=703135 RepID=A0A2A9N6R9_9AGAR|nr:hypothetical protein AMATHDRAFT_51855 [Amanita thiersii Skay4041]
MRGQASWRTGWTALVGAFGRLCCRFLSCACAGLARRADVIIDEELIVIWRVCGMGVSIPMGVDNALLGEVIILVPLVVMLIKEEVSRRDDCYLIQHGRGRLRKISAEEKRDAQEGRKTHWHVLVNTVEKSGF